MKVRALNINSICFFCDSEVYSLKHHVRRHKEELEDFYQEDRYYTCPLCSEEDKLRANTKAFYDDLEGLRQHMKRVHDTTTEEHIIKELGGRIEISLFEPDELEMKITVSQTNEARKDRILEHIIEICENQGFRVKRTQTAGE